VNTSDGPAVVCLCHVKAVRPSNLTRNEHESICGPYPSQSPSLWIALPRGGAVQEPRAKRIKAKGAKDMFKKEFIEERRALGKPCNPASDEFWSDFRAAWEGLSAAKMQNLQDRADSNKTEANAQRKREVPGLHSKRSEGRTCLARQGP